MEMGVFLIFNISGGEIFFVLLIVVMLFGADKIPDIAKGLGKGIKEVRNAANDLKSEINNSTKDDEDLQKFRKKIEDEKKGLEDIAGSVRRKLDL